MSLLVFYIIAAIALGSATGVVVTKNVVHSAIFLLITLGAIAAFFILLLSEFLARNIVPLMKKIGKFSVVFRQKFFALEVSPT